MQEIQRIRVEWDEFTSEIDKNHIRSFYLELDEELESDFASPGFEARVEKESDDSVVRKSEVELITALVVYAFAEVGFNFKKDVVKKLVKVLVDKFKKLNGKLSSSTKINRIVFKGDGRKWELDVSTDNEEVAQQALATIVKAIEQTAGEISIIPQNRNSG